MGERLVAHHAASSLSAGSGGWLCSRGVNRRCRAAFMPSRQRCSAELRCSSAVARQVCCPGCMNAFGASACNTWGAMQAVLQTVHSPGMRLLEQIDYQDMYCRQLVGNITTQVLWQRLEPLLWYLPSDVERQQVAEALHLAAKAHDGQRRKSGEPFITHPVEVTRILAEMRADMDSLIAGLLHDTVEDTEAISFDDIEARFGTAVRRIVEGETKISKITRASPDGDDKAKDLQGLFMAMTEDVRIILVKLADRLHNMRTLYGMKPEKQIKISQETLQVFAPLAKLLGVYCVKEELEDLSLRYMQPQLYHHIRSWQDKQLAQYQTAFAAGRGDLEALLSADPYLQRHARGWAVRVRQKSAYSVYKQLLGLQAAKEQADTVVRQETVAAGSAAAAAEGSSHGKKNGRGPLRRPVTSAAAAAAAVAASSSNAAAAAAAAGRPAAGVNLLPHLKQLPDRAVFLQVIVDEQEAGAGTPDYQMEAHQLCYYVLGLVHSIWSPIPGALQDFIGSPKTNGYQSLHTRVVPLSILSKNCPLLPMEVQIRTAKMDKLADLGVAATNWGVSSALLRRTGSRSSLLSASSSQCLDSTAESSTDSFEDEANGAGGASTAAVAAAAGGEADGAAPTAAAAAAGGAVDGSTQTGKAAARASGGSRRSKGSAVDAAGKSAATSSSSSAGGSSNGSSSSSASKARDPSSGSSSGTFWMNLASFMLESMAAGGTSLAAITGAITGGSSNGKAAGDSKPLPAASNPNSSSSSSSSSEGGGGDEGSELQGVAELLSSNGNGNSRLGGEYRPAGGQDWVLGPSSSQATSSSSSSSSSSSNNGNSSTHGSSNGNGNGSSRAAGDMYMPLPGSNGNGRAPAGAASSNGWSSSSSSGDFRPAPVGGSTNGTGRAAPAAAATPDGVLSAAVPPAASAGAAGVPFMPSYMPLEQLDSNWLTQMRKWQEEFVGSLSAREFVDGVTAEVLGQSVFVYTHTGELRRLPKGSTVVDFAYSVHTQLGNEMRAALVNGRLVAPSYVLSNGEVVEIRREPGVSAASVRRHEQWVGLVHTRSAKLKIKQFIKEHGHLTMRQQQQQQQQPDSANATTTTSSSSSSSATAGLDRRTLEDIQELEGDVVKTLCVRCKDKMGLLALVCSIISDSGHNIKSVSGLPEADGEYNMTFVIKGLDAALPYMLEQIMQVDGVQSYSVSCAEDPVSSGED